MKSINPPSRKRLPVSPCLHSCDQQDLLNRRSLSVRERCSPEQPGWVHPFPGPPHLYCADGPGGAQLREQAFGEGLWPWLVGTEMLSSGGHGVFILSLYSRKVRHPYLPSLTFELSRGSSRLTHVPEQVARAISGALWYPGRGTAHICGTAVTQSWVPRRTPGYPPARLDTDVQVTESQSCWVWGFFFSMQ